MTTNELRYMELIYRKAFLLEIKNKIDEDSKNKTMLMFAKVMDENIDTKQVGTLILLKRWIEEIDKELKSLEDKVFEGFMEDELESAKEKTKDK